MEHTTPTWIRVAGSRTRIMAGDPRAWRCYIDPDLTEHPITRAVVTGTVTERNCLTEVNKEGDARGIFAWIRYYGNVVIADDVAYISLADPDATAPTP